MSLVRLVRATADIRFLFYVAPSVRAFSSVGQSNRLITEWSAVRIRDGAPFKKSSVDKPLQDKGLSTFCFSQHNAQISLYG